MTDPDREPPARRPAAALAANVSSLAEDAWNRLDFRRRLVLAAEIYTETQPAFFGLTGQYARYSGSEIEALDKQCLLTP